MVRLLRAGLLTLCVACFLLPAVARAAEPAPGEEGGPGLALFARKVLTARQDAPGVIDNAVVLVRELSHLPAGRLRTGLIAAALCVSLTGLYPERFDRSRATAASSYSSTTRTLSGQWRIFRDVSSIMTVLVSSKPKAAPASWAQTLSRARTVSQAWRRCATSSSRALNSAG